MGKRVIRQVNIGIWWGAIKLIFGNVTAYLQYIILFFTGITAYATLSLWLKQAFDFDLFLWQFALAVIIIVVGLVVFEYSMSLPSYFKMWNNQWWNHGNPMKDEIKKLHEEINELKGIIERQSANTKH